MRMTWDESIRWVIGKNVPADEVYGTLFRPHLLEIDPAAAVNERLEAEGIRGAECSGGFRPRCCELRSSPSEEVSGELIGSWAVHSGLGDERAGFVEGSCHGNRDAAAALLGIRALAGGP